MPAMANIDKWSSSTEPGLQACLPFLNHWRNNFEVKNHFVFRLRTFIILIFLLIVSGVTYYRFLGVWGISSNTDLNSMWKSKDYESIISYGYQVLERTPLDEEVLLYMGFSYFYRSLGQPEEEFRSADIDQAIIFLRRVLSLESPAIKEKIFYVLGKCYFHKGNHYIDLAIRYLKDSIENGFVNTDSYEYLAQAYAQSGNTEESLRYFNKMAGKETSEKLLIVFAEELIRAGKTKDAEEVLKKNLLFSRNDILLEKSLFLLADLYYNTSRFGEAEEILQEVMDIGESPDAHYRLGLIYEALNLPARARAEWRNAIALDPSHRGALERLSNG